MDPVSEASPEIDLAPELHLLTDWGAAPSRPRWREAAFGSIGAHIALLILLATLPNSAFFTPRRPLVDRRQVTPLVAPPFELTQPDPNKGKISKSVNMESLLP